MSLVIGRIAPEQLNAFGDLQNSRVLVLRAAWAGLPISVVDVRTPSDWRAFDAIIIGSGPAGMLPQALDLLMAGRDRLRAALDEQVPILAISAGFELLGAEIELTRGATRPGLGLLPHRSFVTDRTVGRIEVQAGDRTLVGFENHDRCVEGITAPFGMVLRGAGNGDGLEGVRDGSLIGLHVHGPVLSLNPWLADEMLTVLAKRAGTTYATGSEHEQIDAWTATARENVT